MHLILQFIFERVPCVCDSYDQFILYINFFFSSAFAWPNCELFDYQVAIDIQLKFRMII